MLPKITLDCKSNNWYRIKSGYYEKRCEILQEALEAVCLAYCVVDDIDDFEYGQRPIKSQGNALLKQVMNSLDINEGDPECLLWRHNEE